MKQIWKSAFVAIAMVCTLLLSACAEPITEGTIYDKEFTPAHTSTYILPQSMYINGRVTIINIPHTSYEDDKYVLYISCMVDDERRTNSFEVSKDVYDSYEIGDWFTYYPDADSGSVTQGN